jgi:hypothetical protein
MRGLNMKNLKNQSLVPCEDFYEEKNSYELYQRFGRYAPFHTDS